MKIALLNMPSASIHRPSIGLGLLQAALQQRGIVCDTYYPNLLFASMIGVKEYDFLTNIAPTTSFGGEWLFAQSLFGVDNAAEYRAVLESIPSVADVNHETFMQRLLTMREQVEPFFARVLQEIDWESYDIIGFTSVFEQNVASLSLAKRIKERWPEKFVILGGANAEGEMGHGLLEAFPFVDAVCSGEGDISFVHFIERMVETGDPRQCQTQGITMQPSYSDSLELPLAVFDSSPPVHEMDQLPYPNYDDYFRQFEQHGFVQAGVRTRFLFESSRGCWWGAKSHCTFCGLNGTTMAYRSKSADRALAELLHLRERYLPYTNKAAAVDNIIDMQYFRDFLPMIRDRKLDLDMFYETKANLTKEQVQLFRDAGFYNIQPGIESLITSVLRLMKKGVSMLQNIQLLKWTQEFGVNPLWNFLYGFPGENAEEYEKVPELMRALHHLQPPAGMGQIRLDRFSPNFDHATEYGIVNIRPKKAFTMAYPGLTAELQMKISAHFEFDYVSGMKPASYIGGVRKGIAAWQKAYGESEFFSVDLGEHLVLVDLRPLAGEDNLVAVSGLEKRIYQLCDNLRSLKTIFDTLNKEGLLSSEEEVRLILDRFLSRKWMVEEAGVYLSLAIPLGNYSPKPKGLERMTQLIGVPAAAEVAAT